MSLLPVPTSQDLQVSRTESPTCLQQPWSPISNSTGFRPHLLPGRLSHHYQLQTPTPNLGLAHSGDLDALDSNPSPPEKTLPRQKSTLRRTSTDVPNTERPVILPVSDLRTLPKKTSPAQREFPVQSHTIFPFSSAISRPDPDTPCSERNPNHPIQFQHLTKEPPL